MRGDGGRPGGSGTILEVAGLTMRFGGLVAVDSVSFDARRGWDGRPSSLTRGPRSPGRR